MNGPKNAFKNSSMVDVLAMLLLNHHILLFASQAVHHPVNYHQHFVGPVGTSISKRTAVSLHRIHFQLPGAAHRRCLPARHLLQESQRTGAWTCGDFFSCWGKRLSCTGRKMHPFHPVFTTRGPSALQIVSRKSEFCSRYKISQGF